LYRVLNGDASWQANTLRKRKLAYIGRRLCVRTLKSDKEIMNLRYMYKDIMDSVVIVGNVDYVEKSFRIFFLPYIWGISQMEPCIY
jgi:hypothetical protein